MEIYVVMGTTGEYSDRSEWSVKAFSDEKKAKKFVREASKIAESIHAAAEYADNKWLFRREAKSPLDENFDIDYTGTSYFYYTVQLDD